MAAGDFATHSDFYGKGGYRVVATLADRYTIPLSRQLVGMLVYVQAGGGATYRLNTVAFPTIAGDWDLQGGGGSGGAVVSVGGTAPIQSSGGANPVISLSGERASALFGNGSAITYTIATGLTAYTHFIVQVEVVITGLIDYTIQAVNTGTPGQIQITLDTPPALDSLRWMAIGIA